MSIDRQPVLAPSYVEKFSCIGPSCSDSCCATNWRVNVDKATYKKLIRLPTGDLSRRLKGNILKHPTPSTLQYAELQMQSGQCPALTDDKLCGIQAEHGQSHLPKVCHSFPRYTFAAGLGHEIHLSLACPEAARLCIEDQTSGEMKAIALNAPAASKLIVMGGFRVTDPNQLRTSFPKAFTLIRTFIDRILRTTELAVWERLLAIEFACDKIDALRRKCEGRWPEDDVEQILLELTLSVLDGSFKERLKPIADRSVHQALSAKFVEIMTNTRVQMGVTSAKAQQFFELVSEAFGAYNADSASRRQSLTAVAYQPINSVAGQAAENFLRNQIGVNNFPSLDKISLSVQWREIVATCAMVRFYLRWLAVARGEHFTTHDAVQIIQGFSKLASHNTEFLPAMRSQLKSAGLDGAAGLVVLTQ